MVIIEISASRCKRIENFKRADKYFAIVIVIIIIIIIIIIITYYFRVWNPSNLCFSYIYIRCYPIGNF